MVNLYKFTKQNKINEKNKSYLKNKRNKSKLSLW